MSLPNEPVRRTDQTDRSGAPQPPIALDRPVAFFDLETTGLRPTRDRIVELAVVIVSPDGAVDERVRRFNPEISIPPQASSVHGITDDQVADEAPFRLRARSLAKLLESCDLAGFNLRGFDLPMLEAEFERAGVDFDLTGRRLADMKLIYHREEPRNLSAAVRFYLKRDHGDAHSAMADTRATADVLWAQLGRYPHLPRDMEGLHEYCDGISPYRTAFEKWFERTPGGLKFNRGKHKGELLHLVAAAFPDYLEWMLDADDMPVSVLQAVREALQPSPSNEDSPR